MLWQLLVWGAATGAAGALAAACRPATAAARRHEAVPGTVAAATGALVVLMVTGLLLTALAGLPAWAGAGWLAATAGAAGWIALRRQDPAAWGLTAAPSTTAASATATPAATMPAATTMPTTTTTTTAATAQPESAQSARMRPDLADQDDLVQSLTVASYALQLGDARRAHQAVEAALSRSRATLDLLLREEPAGRRFIRATPATTSTPGHPAGQGHPAGPAAA
ncbi:MFS transporter [Frankia sp. AgPm24]|uniref:MFS transporter n=1 Tax=Frankia sp. AgPm24 TaxID=631128 RepID=UPI00200CFBF7|nr:MFS transporter [Frankia sp. AgPm24]MCK9920404.1 MFS transporter [Frankia sp. AgPm24]